MDAVHDGPLSFAARCAPLATPALARQLAASQLPAAAWQAMRREQLVSLVRVRAVTRPDGAPAPTPSVAYLRVYATRVTVTTAGRATVSDGVTAPAHPHRRAVAGQRRAVLVTEPAVIKAVTAAGAAAVAFPLLIILLVTASPAPPAATAAPAGLAGAPTALAEADIPPD